MDTKVERHVGEFTGMQFGFMKGNWNSKLTVRQLQEKILVKVNKLSLSWKSWNRRKVPFCSSLMIN